MVDQANPLTVEQLEQQIGDLQLRLAAYQAAQVQPAPPTAGLPAAGQAVAPSAQVQGDGGGPLPHMLASARPTWALIREPWTYWGQRWDPTPEGIADNNRFNNCGAESCSMTLKYVADFEIAAGLIKDQMVGQDYTGYLNWDNLRYWWHRYAGADTHVVAVPATPQGRSQLEWAIWDAMMKGYTCIGLYFFSAPGSNDGHFRVITELHGSGHDLQTVVTADPWTGQRRVETADQHWAWIQNQMMVIKRKRAVST